MTHTHIRGVLLDIDGTLVDSNDAHACAWLDTLKEHGYQASYFQVRQLIGKGGDHLLPEVTGVDKDTPEGQRISRRRAQIFTERYLPELRAFPHVRELLERMRDDGLKLVVATSAQAEELDKLLELANVKDLIEQQTSASDTEHSKPDPDVVQAALDRLGCRPEEALMLGDTPYDIQAARQAGVGTVALRSGGFADTDLAGALAIYDAAADLLAHYDESPLARAREVSGL